MAMITQNPDLLALAPFYTVYEKMLAELPTEHILKSVRVQLSGSNAKSTVKKSGLTASVLSLISQ